MIVQSQLQFYGRCSEKSCNSKVWRSAAKLFIAIQNNDLTALKLLVGHKANIDLADSTGMTPLVATIVGKPAMAKFLLEAGAKVDGEKIAEMTPCRYCHGSKGIGSTVNTTPDLAGQHSAYLEKQLRDYQNNRRLDVRMNKHVKAMNEEVIQALATYYAKQDAKPIADSGDAQDYETGSDLYSETSHSGNRSTCASCHGKDGINTSDTLTPIIAGLDAQYTEIQLKNFRDGKRTNDIDGVMRSSVSGWSNEQITSVANYIESLR